MVRAAFIRGWVGLEQGPWQVQGYHSDKGAGLQGAGAGLLLPFPGIFGLSASAGCGIVTVLGIFLLF